MLLWPAGTAVLKDTSSCFNRACWEVDAGKSCQDFWFLSALLERCPGFGQDRVNFHWTPGRGTAGGWGLTPPGQTEPGVPYHVTSRWVPGWGGARRRSCLGERLSGPYSSLLCFLLICTVAVPVFPLFAVLLNCPYPDPPVSASFFSFSSAPWWGEGRPRGAFVAGGSQNQNTQSDQSSPINTDFFGCRNLFGKQNMMRK